ncbi:MAG: electron transport complex subunit RsxC, partial [Halioglobus sp.]
MRKTFGFHGGIHPPENKHQSVRTPIAYAGIPPELTLPLSQHIGAPARPVVAVGDRVLKGQMVAAAAGFVSVPVHAPTSGTVSAIEDRLIAHPSGYRAPCIVIATDGRDEWIAHHGTPDYTALDKADLINLIRDAGIAGMGGAGFPSAVKLSVQPGTHIETLILNGTECEPYITADDILMRERADQIVAGAKILRHIIAPDETLVGVEDNKPEGLAALRAAAEGTGIEIVEFPTKYPSGGEKQLIEILTGKQVPSGGLPSQVGVVCQNIGTTVAIYDAVVHGRPLISRITTVTGDSVREPQNFEVLIGTPMRYLLAKAGYQPDHNKRLIMGGPMMGFTVPDPDVPIVKTTNCLLAPTESELPTPPPPQACIRCGMCAEACPVSLLPQQMFWFAQGKEFEKLEKHNLFDCIECGACSYACPSNIPLVQYYRAAKAEI